MNKNTSIHGVLHPRTPGDSYGRLIFDIKTSLIHINLNSSLYLDSCFTSVSVTFWWWIWWLDSSYCIVTQCLMWLWSVVVALEWNVWAMGANCLYVNYVACCTWLDKFWFSIHCNLDFLPSIHFILGSSCLIFI